MTLIPAPEPTDHTNVYQAFDRSAQLLAPGDALPTEYRYAPTLPKACVHPLRTPAGHRLSGFEMSDHVWHRGLWFTIKYINKTNFWEEEKPFGLHVNRAQPVCEMLDAHTTRLTHRVGWESDATGCVFEETRSLTFRAHGDGVRTIDWSADLAAQQDLTLDRTPYTTWGGYGGLSLRAAREMHQVNFLLPDGSTSELLTGQPHDWALMQGVMDGGVDQRVALGIIDHPDNPRSPSPWYGKTVDITYLNAAFLFHQPMDVAKGDTLRFRYRVAYRDGHWSADQFAKLADEFRNQPQES